MAIHPTAIVDARARIADGAEIGPYCIIGAGVDIGAGTRLIAHVFVESVTKIGDDNLVMAYSHIAHDVHIGNHAVLSNGATCGGHVVIGDWAVIGAFSGVHQYCRVGRHAMIGGYSVITQDVLPFSMTVSPREVKIFGPNKTGLERRGFSPEAIEGLHKAFRLLAKSGLNTTQAVDRISNEVEMGPEIDELLAFIASSERGFVK